MSTPQEEQRRKTAEEWYASLDDAGRTAVDRSIKVFTALDPIFEAVNRSVEFTRRTRQALSEGAQALVSQTQQFGRDTAARAGQTRTDLAARAGDLRDRAGVTAEVAATRLGDGLDATGRAISSGVAATRNAAVSAAQATGRAGVATGQRAAALVGKVSRWFQEKVSNTASRAAAGYHAVKALPPNQSAGQPSISALAATTVASRIHASLQEQAELNAVVGSLDKDKQAMLMAALVNAGQAPPTGAVNATATQTPDGRATPTQPSKGPDLSK